MRRSRSAETISSETSPRACACPRAPMRVVEREMRGVGRAARDWKPAGVPPFRWSSRAPDHAPAKGGRRGRRTSVQHPGPRLWHRADDRADSGRSKSGRTRPCRRRWRRREGGPHGASFRCHRKRHSAKARPVRDGVERHSEDGRRVGAPGNAVGIEVPVIDRLSDGIENWRGSGESQSRASHLPPRRPCRKDGEGRFLASEKPGSEVARARFSMDRIQRER